MPLYLDNSVILDSYQPPVAYALLRIKAQMEGKNVNPKLAVRLMRQELHPLLDQEHHDILNDLKYPTWRDIHWTYPKMVYRAGPTKYLMLDIARCIWAIYQHTTVPARDEGFEKPEIQQLLAMSKNAGKDITHLGFIGKDNFDVLVSCRYCWRQPMPKRVVCTTHAGGEKFKEDGIGLSESTKGRSDSALRKEAYRQEELFEKTLNRRLSDEVWQFHDSDFKAQVLIPAKDIWIWLKTNRAEIAQLLIEESLPTDDNSIIDSLIYVLHTPTNLSSVYEQPYLRANEAFRNEPQLMWPMLLRADCWLVTRKEFRKNWGGKRVYKQPQTLVKSLISWAINAFKFSKSFFSKDI